MAQNLVAGLTLGELELDYAATRHARKCQRKLLGHWPERRPHNQHVQFVPARCLGATSRVYPRLACGAASSG